MEWIIEASNKLEYRYLYVKLALD